MKLDKQEIVGVVTAVERWLTMNHEDRLLGNEERLARVEEELEAVRGIQTGIEHVPQYYRRNPERNLRHRSNWQDGPGHRRRARRRQPTHLGLRRGRPHHHGQHPRPKRGRGADSSRAHPNSNRRLGTAWADWASYEYSLQAQAIQTVVPAQAGTHPRGPYREPDAYTYRTGRLDLPNLQHLHVLRTPSYVTVQTSWASSQ